jgi:arylsulfatase A-like enzyme
MTTLIKPIALAAALVLTEFAAAAAITPPPNIVLIYADDLGYGDLGCYGAKAIRTPNIDRLAAQGLRFTDGYATSATCTPSRYALLTGKYPWRRKDTDILAGDAPLIIQPGSATLPAVLQKAGYQTAVIGKWHLGLGSPDNSADWNGVVTPGPRQVGFTFNHIMAATGDRVPTVYVENDRVVNLDPIDPIRVSYGKKTGNEPTGRDNPELLKMRADDQHSDTITSGVSRIGFMTGGKSARWKDEEHGDHFLKQAVSYIEAQKDGPFFLYYASHEPHVPRVPAPRFVGATGLGPRGDVIVQFDEQVGELMKTLERLQLRENTLVILSSDNGPVLNDGYMDEADNKNGDHTPGGPYSGGKYSKLEAGTRVPLITCWPGVITPGVSEAPVSQIDFLASFAALGLTVPPPGTDSRDVSDVLLGKQKSGRDHIVQQGIGGLALRSGNWKYIPPANGPEEIKSMRSGNASKPQLYDLTKDPGEKENLATKHPEKLKELAAQLEAIRAGS